MKLLQLSRLLKLLSAAGGGGPPVGVFSPRIYLSLLGKQRERAAEGQRTPIYLSLLGKQRERAAGGQRTPIEETKSKLIVKPIFSAEKPKKPKKPKKPIFGRSSNNPPSLKTSRK